MRALPTRGPSNSASVCSVASRGLKHIQNVAMWCAASAAMSMCPAPSAGPDCNRCDAARCGYLQSYSEGFRVVQPMLVVSAPSPTAGSSISGIWFRDLVMLNGDRHSVCHADQP